MNNDNKRSAGGLGLVGDIGGTNARFALWRGQRLESIEVLACADYPRPELAVRDYLARIGESVANIDSVCLACAGPVGAADFRFTNNHWVINRAAFREELGLDHLLLVNDFSTMAWAASRLGADELVQVRAGSAQADRARLIIGPGTGLGVGSLLPLGGGRWEVLPCEGGHVDLPVTSPRDFALWQGLQARDGHVSAERALSGNGLLALYEISCALDGVAVRASSAAEVGALAMAGDAQADAVLEHFFLWLARVAGNAVLTVGALGGVYITGGIVPRFLERFIASGFAEAFARRGKTSGAYLQDVPVWVMTAEHPGLLGAGVALQQALDAEG
ncbi:TPA: glucokinase [Pseudomonas aeruginosa]|nr:glucokinase [Pseudomonas aeruginosa]HCE8035944.1 glucokinase [Pseudomonas aeruginosa]HCE8256485.1 glucokinase [Pseudomonas aeruginosa]HCE8439069.1 glucokinase [Pseudomonas aeruginosa]HCE8444072.1 glucokinase [Pseudomonas aeruginosa]